MLNLCSRAQATPEEVRRLGPLGAFDWCASKLRDAAAATEQPARIVVEIWIEHPEEAADGLTTPCHGG